MSFMLSLARFRLCLGSDVPLLPAISQGNILPAATCDYRGLPGVPGT